MSNQNPRLPLLQIKNISVSIAKSVLINSVNLNVFAGELTCVIGANGAGKSTLIKAVSSDLAVSSGEIFFLGKNLNHWTMQLRAKHLSVLPQSSTLNFPYVVEDVIQLGRTPHASGLKSDTLIVKEVMTVLDMNHLAGRVYTQLSGGEKQRVQLARVFAQIWRAEDTGGRLLILDEPVTSLDLGHQQQLMAIIKQFTRQGVAVLSVLHDLNLVSEFSDKVVAMKGGEIVANGAVEQVLTPALIYDLFSAKVQMLPHPKTERPVIFLCDD